MLVEPQIIAVKACASKQNAFDKPQLEVVNIIKGYGWIIYQSKPKFATDQLKCKKDTLIASASPILERGSRMKYAFL